MPVIEPIQAAKARINKRKGRPRLEDARPHIAEKAIAAYIATGSGAQAAKIARIGETTVFEILKRNPEAITEARKKQAVDSLRNSALLSSGITKSKVKKLNALQCAIGSKVSSQQALELLDLLPSSITINLAVLGQSGEAIARLAQETEQIRAAMAKQVEVVAEEPIKALSATVEPTTSE